MVRAVFRATVEVRRVLAGDEPFGLEFGDELVVDVEAPLGGGDPGAVILGQGLLLVAAALRRIGSGGAVVSTQLSLVGAGLTRVSSLVGRVHARAQIVHLCLHVGVADRLTCIHGGNLRPQWTCPY